MRISQSTIYVQYSVSFFYLDCIFVDPVGKNAIKDQVKVIYFKLVRHRIHPKDFYNLPSCLVCVKSAVLCKILHGYKRGTHSFISLHFNKITKRMHIYFDDSFNFLSPQKTKTKLSNRNEKMILISRSKGIFFQIHLR